MSEHVKAKVSGTGWLCVYRKNAEPNLLGPQHWVPVFKLTPEQLREYAEVLDRM